LRVGRISGEASPADWRPLSRLLEAAEEEVDQTACFSRNRVSPRDGRYLSDALVTTIAAARCKDIGWCFGEAFDPPGH
jgi:hypothetical protein